MVIDEQLNNRRTCSRESVRWPILWNDVEAVADVCDISPDGVFVRPFVANVSDLLFEGDRLRFRCRLPGGYLEIWGTVRWVGWSTEHQCEGFGVQFEKTEPAIDTLRMAPPVPGDFTMWEDYWA